MINNTTRIHVIRNQKGSILLTFAISIVGLFCFSVVAIDGAILMTTKNELQCAADAAALAGASGLRGTNDPVASARFRAITIAGRNFAVQDRMRPCVITNADVQVNTTDGWVRVTTHRTTATDDPLRTYFLKILDLALGISPGRANTVDVTAVAKAELVDNCAAKCVKPWAIPDRWQDVNGNGGMFEPGIDIYDPNITGYLAPGDVGLSIVLKQGQQNDPVVPGQYFPIDLPPVNRGTPLPGANNYRNWIATCAQYIVAPGDTCLLEPGNMQGPTIQGVVDLINLDPSAHWNALTKQVEGSNYGQSPRIALVPFYDPNYPPQSGRNNVVISKIGAFFIESVGPGSQVNGRFLQVNAPGEPCAVNTGNSLILGLHLIE